MAGNARLVAQLSRREDRLVCGHCGKALGAIDPTWKVYLRPEVTAAALQGEPAVDAIREIAEDVPTVVYLRVLLFDEGWAERDGVWRLGSRARLRLRAGQEPRGKRFAPYTEADLGDEKMAPRPITPAAYPARAECYRCGYVQILDKTKLRVAVYGDDTGTPWQLRNPAAVAARQLETLRLPPTSREALLRTKMAEIAEIAAKADTGDLPVGRAGAMAWAGRKAQQYPRHAREWCTLARWLGRASPENRKLCLEQYGETRGGGPFSGDNHAAIWVPNEAQFAGLFLEWMRTPPDPEGDAATGARVRLTILGNGGTGARDAPQSDGRARTAWDGVVLTRARRAHAAP